LRLDAEENMLSGEVARPHLYIGFSQLDFMVKALEGDDFKLLVDVKEAVLVGRGSEPREAHVLLA
jgi:hypothetical protein